MSTGQAIAFFITCVAFTAAAFLALIATDIHTDRLATTYTGRHRTSEPLQLEAPRIPAALALAAGPWTQSTPVPVVEPEGWEEPMRREHTIEITAEMRRAALAGAR